MAIYRQATAPAYEAGGLWFDSDDNDKPYYGTGGSWAALNPGSLFTDFSDTDHVQDADVLLGQRGAGGVNYLGSTFITKNAAGNVGIGVVPSNWFSGGMLQGTSFSISQVAGLDQTAWGTGVYQNVYVGPWLARGAYPATLYEQLSGIHKWSSSSSMPAGAGSNANLVERMRIDTVGSLIFGRTSVFGGFGNEPETGFSMAGGINGYMAINVAGSNGALYISRRAGASGVIASFATELTQTGSITTNGTTTTYNTTSDYRLKDEVAPLDGSGAFIDALKPKKWLWKENGTPGAGFIAHEFAEVSPSSVIGEKDATTLRTITDQKTGKEKTIEVPDYQSMQASSPEVMAHIIAELQSLRARVAQLEAGQ